MADIFFDNPTIQFLGEVERWTVSDRNKRPLDMRGIIERNEVVGARTHDADCLVDLATVRETIPDAVNSCLWLDASVDGYLVIDIEPGCPDDVRDRLLSIPHEYAERSMSGKGYHLLVRNPSNVGEFPAATGKAKLQHPERWFELLLTHWCTFTHDVVELPASEPATTIEEVFAELAASAKKTSVGTGGRVLGADLAERPEFDPEVESEIVQSAVEVLRAKDDAGTLKGPADFANDMSRYEFYILSAIYSQLARNHASILTVRRLTEKRHAVLSRAEMAWLVYLCATSILQPRDKHDTLRHGVPFLLHQAAVLVSTRK